MARLLIVDDDPFVTESLKVGLGDHGHQVFAGHNGREGVQLVEELTPDLVIIDMTMPVMDGLEATEQIRQQSNVPIIMLTAETDEEDVIHALEKGVDEYLGKPFRLNELAARIQALIRRHHWEKTQIESEVAQLKQRLIGILTHEMRTPIATILNTLEIVFASAEEENFQSQLRFLEHVQHNTHILNGLVEDLLIMAQIDEGLKILRRPFLLHNELERLIDKKRVDLVAQDLIIHNNISPELTMNGDVHKLRHLFHHLLDNAVKFSLPKQEILIWAQQNVSGEVELGFEDQGAGIAPCFHEQIFERFFQIEQGDNRAYGGLGVGLSIVKAVAEAHNGRIHLESSPNAGSKFIVTLANAEADWAI